MYLSVTTYHTEFISIMKILHATIVKIGASIMKLVNLRNYERQYFEIVNATKVSWRENESFLFHGLNEENSNSHLLLQNFNKF